MMLHFQEIFDIKLTRQEYRYQKSRDFSTYQKWIGFHEIIFLTIKLTSYVSCVDGEIVISLFGEVL